MDLGVKVGPFQVNKALLIPSSSRWWARMTSSPSTWKAWVRTSQLACRIRSQRPPSRSDKIVTVGSTLLNTITTSRLLSIRTRSLRVTHLPTVETTTTTWQVRLRMNQASMQDRTMWWGLSTTWLTRANQGLTKRTQEMGDQSLPAVGNLSRRRFHPREAVVQSDQEDRYTTCTSRSKLSKMPW